MIFDRDQLSPEKDTQTILKSIELFKGLDEDAIQTIMETATLKQVERGEAVIKLRQKSDRFFIILRGRFAIRVSNAVKAELASGDLFGEIGFFAGVDRTAEVIATRSGAVMELDQTTYDTLNRKLPELSDAIVGALARRLSNVLPNVAADRAFFAHNHRVVGLMASYDGGLPDTVIEKICTLVDHLNGWEIVRSDETDLDMSCASAADLSRWLEVHQPDKNAVLLCRNPVSNHCWADAVRENSDQIFLFGENHLADDGPVALSSFEDQVFQSRKHNDLHLVLWREKKEDRTRYTKNWLKNRPVKLHHQLALDRKDDLSRISDLIEGKQVDINF